MMYSIYQVKNAPTYEKYLFASTRDLSDAGLAVSRENYDLVWSSRAIRGRNDDEHALSELYARFNLRHPTGYKGRSMSVSDVVVIDGRAYYVDPFAFVPIEFI